MALVIDIRSGGQHRQLFVMPRRSMTRSDACVARGRRPDGRPAPRQRQEVPQHYKAHSDNTERNRIRNDGAVQKAAFSRITASREARHLWSKPILVGKKVIVD
ncbi:hypothetical protein [Mesorhizobium escarrei]|uniref:hypothetical protein n=1 Tax=Mesorhizobium escarrei TaxID=666018 RepID=UPI0020A77FFF|nr:hypothetical protein [Mesorhizobium escarrei]